MCRSPMAEAVAMVYAPNLKIISCGIRTLKGYPATKNTQIVCLERGLDLKDHKSKCDSQSILNKSLVLCMDKKQKETIQKRYKGLEVYLLTEKGTGSLHEITDPTGRGINAHRETIISIENEVKALINNLSDINSII